MNGPIFAWPSSLGTSGTTASTKPRRVDSRMVVALASSAMCGAPGCAPRHPAPPATAIANAAPDDGHAPPPLVGRWRVVGCETSPSDPADCGRGEIEFTPDRVTIAVPAGPGTSLPYEVVSAASDRIVISVDGDASEIVLDPDGAAHWRAPGLGGRVGRLMFVRDRP